MSRINVPSPSIVTPSPPPTASNSPPPPCPPPPSQDFGGLSARELSAELQAADGKLFYESCADASARRARPLPSAPTTHHEDPSLLLRPRRLA